MKFVSSFLFLLICSARAYKVESLTVPEINDQIDREICTFSPNIKIACLEDARDKALKVTTTFIDHLQKDESLNNDQIEQWIKLLNIDKEHLAASIVYDDRTNYLKRWQIIGLKEGETHKTYEADVTRETKVQSALTGARLTLETVKEEYKQALKTAEAARVEVERRVEMERKAKLQGLDTFTPEAETLIVNAVPIDKEWSSPVDFKGATQPIDHDAIDLQEGQRKLYTQK